MIKRLSHVAPLQCGGVLAAFIYNLLAGWTGGLEFTTTDVAPAVPSQTNLPTTY